MFAYCALYVCACGISFCTYQTIVALSAKLTRATTTEHTGCNLPIYIPFLLGLCPKYKKYVEQVEKSFL